MSSKIKITSEELNALIKISEKYEKNEYSNLFISSKIKITSKELNVLIKICERCGKYEYLNLLYENIQEWIDKGYDELSLEDLKEYISSGE